MTVDILELKRRPPPYKKGSWGFPPYLALMSLSLFRFCFGTEGFSRAATAAL
jgi:hypothetical protein